MVRFLKPEKKLILKTVNGPIEILNNEYFILEDEGRKSLVINKEGIQKIEDFFLVKTEILREGEVGGVLYVTVRMTTPQGLQVERIGSANERNLTNAISRAYPLEMAFKRACATAALEVLRKNYIGETPLPLLYSSFDEFQAEEGVNANVPKVESAEKKAPVAKQEDAKPAAPESSVNMTEVPGAENPFKEKPDPVSEPAEKEEESAPESEPDDATIKSDLGAFVIKSNKYRNGITLAELAEKDINYLAWLVQADNMKGKYQEYQKTARKFVEEAGITLPD